MNVDSLLLDGTRAGIAGIAPWLARLDARWQLGTDLSFAIRLCLEEAATNIVSHGFDADTTDRAIAIRATATATAVTIEVADAGRPFDPTAAPLPGTGNTLDDAPVGGRGLRLMRGFADTLAYRRRDGRNTITMTFARNERVAAPSSGLLQ